MEVIVGVLVGVPAGVYGYLVGRSWAGRPVGRHEVGVSARRVCASLGSPVRHRRVSAHAG